MALKSYIDLLRHGETLNSTHYCGSTDTPLTADGLKQMWAVAELESPRWTHIVTSPLVRCAKFAQALGQRYVIPVTQDERIMELHFGAWENHSAAELMQTSADALTHFWSNPLRYPPPNAEHLGDFETRILGAWHDIVKKHAGERILLITHGGVIRMILCHILQHPIERLLELKVEQAAIRHILVEHGRNRHHASLMSHAQA